MSAATAGPAERPFQPSPGGVFDAMHAELQGGSIDWHAFDPQAHDPALLGRAQRVWSERVQTEFRSLQIMTRFMTELTGAGEPIEVYAGAVELIADETRHVGLCARLLQAIGGQPALPGEPRLLDPPSFLDAPMVQRATATALTMLAINETLSVAYLGDLAARCRDPLIGAVLQALVEDEDGHDAFGWDYVRWSLGRFDPATRPQWQALAHRTLQRHLSWADEVLGRPVAPNAPLADAPLADAPLPDEPSLAALGLFGPERQAMICRRTWVETIGPRLMALGLA